MRALTSILIATAVVLSSYTKSQRAGIPFQTGGEWRPREQASLGQLPRAMRAAAHPDYCATWTNGLVRHVCLENNGIPSITTVWTVYVFEADGALIEHNVVCPYTGYTPRRLISVSPLRIVFGHPTRDVEEVQEPRYTKEKWQEHMREAQRRYEEAVAKWEADKKKVPRETKPE